MAGTERLIKLMQGHESQQSAPLVASIAILVGNAIRSKQLNISQSTNKALSDIILWEVQVITGKDAWPTRQCYSTNQLFTDPVDRIEAKGIVNDYLGTIASREME